MLQKLRHSVDVLLTYGYRRETVAILKEEANVYLTLGNSTSLVASKREYFITVSKFIPH